MADMEPRDALSASASLLTSLTEKHNEARAENAQLREMCAELAGALKAMVNSEWRTHPGIMAGTVVTGDMLRDAEAALARYKEMTNE